MALQKTERFANLHLHSTYSDGVYSPAELCAMVKEMGYSAVAVSDHETMSGCEAMKAAAAVEGLDFIMGIETYAREFGRSFHILGYDCDPSAPLMAQYLRDASDAAYRSTEAKLRVMQENGDALGISWNDVLDLAPQNAWLCNEHIFAALVKHVGLRQADYWDWIPSFRRAKTSIASPFVAYSAEKMIAVIRSSGGVAVLAHPHNQTRFLPELYRYGLGGVECDHPDINVEDVRAALAFAREHQLYVTGGTDHTGYTGNHADERGDVPARNGGRGDGSLTPYDAYVTNGVSKEDFYALKNRIYG